MLTAYLNRTRQLLQNPSAPTSLYSDSDLTSWINVARGQVAGESEGIRIIGTISAVVGQQSYNFSSINLGVSATTGVQGVIHVRRISYTTGGGQKWITPRAWEWFDFYHLSNTVPVNAAPTSWSQYGQGSAGTGTGSGASGSFYITPPDSTYTLNCDCVCYPIALVNDATVEAVPYLWTDAVSYFAAYLALLSAQTGQRQADAERMLARYTEFTERARKFSNPSVNRYIYQQAGDPTQANKIGISGKGQG